MIVVKKYDSLKKLNDKKFKRAVGIPRELFEIYVLVIIAALKEKHKKRGRNPKLKAEDILLLMFYYYRDYDSYFKLGIYFDIDESNAYRWVKWCEETLQNYSIEPFNNQSLTKEKEYIVDVMECPIERPKMQEIKKKSKYNPLTDEDKELNKLISSNRIAIEHVNSQLKVFKILSERYRNRINSFIPRAIFICSLYNYSL